MITLKDIAKKLLSGELPPLAEGELSEERLKMCYACPSFQQVSRQCNICGCFLDLKTKLLQAECPMGKW